MEKYGEPEPGIKHQPKLISSQGKIKAAPKHASLPKSHCIPR